MKPVPVIQRDRAMAASTGLDHLRWVDEQGRLTTEGKADEFPLVQAFALHRRAGNAEMADWLESRAARSKSTRARRIFTVLADDIRAGLHED